MGGKKRKETKEIWEEYAENINDQKDDMTENTTQSSIKESNLDEEEETFIEEPDSDEEQEPFDEIIEFDYEESGDGKARKRIPRRILWSVLGGILLVILAGYCGTVYYFSSHFFPNVQINGKDFAYQTVEEVQKYFSDQVQDYELNVIGSNDIHDAIKGADIELKFQKTESIRRLMENQHIWMWPAECLKKNKNKLSLKLQYNQELLEDAISKMNVVTTKQIPSESARPEFNGDEYEIKPEIIGTEVDHTALVKVISTAINNLKKEVNLINEKCYLKPEFTAQSPEVKQACDTLNKYIKTKVTYLMDNNEVVDKNLISQWLLVDNKMNVNLKDGVIEEWFKKLGEKYDTVGKTRQYTAPSGKVVTVSGGTYGWSLNEKKEAELLKEYIKKGETIERQPEYYQTAASRSAQDFGNTYVDIDLSLQHMWYVSDGNVVLDTDVVTGTPTPEKITPEGVYSIVEKELNKTLIGATVPETGKPAYKIPVSYWLRVTWEGVGIHDSTWRGSYGGSVYESDGSHGCINTPYDAVQSMYNMVPIGTPVVMHY